MIGLSLRGYCVIEIFVFFRDICVIDAEMRTVHNDSCMTIVAVAIHHMIFGTRRDIS